MTEKSVLPVALNRAWFIARVLDQRPLKSERKIPKATCNVKSRLELVSLMRGDAYYPSSGRIAKHIFFSLCVSPVLLTPVRGSC